MQFQNNFTSSYSVEQVRNDAEISMENRLTFRDIYVQSWQTHSFPIIFRNTPRAWHLVVTSHITQETIFPRVPSCCSSQACIKMYFYERKATLRWNLTFCCMNTNLLTVSESIANLTESSSAMFLSYISAIWTKIVLPLHFYFKPKLLNSVSEKIVFIVRSSFSSQICKVRRGRYKVFFDEYGNRPVNRLIVSFSKSKTLKCENSPSVWAKYFFSMFYMNTHRFQLSPPDEV